MHLLVAIALVAVVTGCASFDAAQTRGPRDFSALSCGELAAEASQAWQRKNERRDAFSIKSEERLVADRQQAKQELKEIKTVAREKGSAMPS